MGLPITFLGAAMRRHLEEYSMPEPNSGCQLWLGAGSSYGVVSRRGERRLAHIIAWENTKGSVPDGLKVCHRCDVPPCINVNHLFLGTQGDNLRDMWIKGRGKTPGTFRGSANKCSILTEADIPRIRSDSRILREIAADYDVHLSLIWLIKRRKVWKHVP